MAVRTHGSSVVGQLREFLEGEVAEYAPDLVIVMERKGTAAYRAALESGAGSGSLPGWDRVVSSESVESVPSSRLRGRRILVVDDMLRKGRTIRSLLDLLRERGVTDDSLLNVRVAAFAVHEDAGLGYPFGDAIFPHAAFLRFLPTESYRAVRGQLVHALQEAGSLMLDTEHIEIRLRLRAPVARLAEALSRTGRVVAFRSAAGRINVTVYYDESTIRPVERESLPGGSRSSGVVRKCRVVERAPGQFALIPICLPDVPRKVSDQWRPREEDVALLGDDVVGTIDEARFYSIALRAAFEPMYLALKDLAAVRPSLCDIKVPSLGALNADGFDLSHLQVMYPNHDLELLSRRIVDECKAAETAGARLRHRRWKMKGVLTPAREELETTAAAVLQRIGRIADARAAEFLSEGGDVLGPTARGLTLSEIIRCGEEIDVPPPIVSACMDILIDEALLVTRVEEYEDEDGCWLCRTYLPDGEVASELVRDFTRRRGLLSPGEGWVER